jgi:hypothetical protein
MATIYLTATPLKAMALTLVATLGMLTVESTADHLEHPFSDDGNNERCYYYHLYETGVAAPPAAPTSAPTSMPAGIPTPVPMLMPSLASTGMPTPVPPTSVPTDIPTDKPLDMYYGKFAFHLVMNANAMEVKSCMEQADVSAALEQSLLTVSDSPLSAIFVISVTSIMRSSVVESKVVAECSIARRHSETVEAIAGKLQRLLHPSDPP